MVKNFIPNCDLCGKEIPEGQYTQRSIRGGGVEFLMVLLENPDPDLLFSEKDDGTVDLDTCRECYFRMAFSHSNAVN